MLSILRRSFECATEWGSEREEKREWETIWATSLWLFFSRRISLMMSFVSSQFIRLRWISVDFWPPNLFRPLNSKICQLQSANHYVTHDGLPLRRQVYWFLIKKKFITIREEIASISKQRGVALAPDKLRAWFIWFTFAFVIYDFPRRTSSFVVRRLGEVCSLKRCRRFIALLREDKWRLPWRISRLVRSRALNAPKESPVSQQFNKWFLCEEKINIFEIIIRAVPVRSRATVS